MRALQTFLLTAIILATSACASNAVQHEPSVVELHTASAPAAIAEPDAAPAPAPSTPLAHDVTAAPAPAAEAGGATEKQVPSPAEQDAEVPDTQALVPDPWEGFNRKMHSFNNAADEFVLRPLAVTYNKITPEPVQTGVSRFFANLSTPVTAVNQALQGRFGDAVGSLGRFAVNTTIGIVGMFDPATSFGLPKRGDEDFGQTLATWGWRDSRYLVLPLLGPRTVRDAVGIVGDQPLSPVGRIQDTGAATGIQVMEFVDVRKRMLPVDKFRLDAFDDYLFIRDAWAQRRNQQIQQDLESRRD